MTSSRTSTAQTQSRTRRPARVRLELTVLEDRTVPAMLHLVSEPTVIFSSDTAVIDKGATYNDYGFGGVTDYHINATAGLYSDVLSGASSYSIQGPLVLEVQPSNRSEKVGDLVKLDINFFPNVRIDSHVYDPNGTPSQHAEARLEADWSGVHILIRKSVSPDASEYDVPFFWLSVMTVPVGSTIQIQQNLSGLAMHDDRGYTVVETDISYAFQFEPILDYAATSLVSNNTKRGVDLTYTLTGAPGGGLTSKPKVAFYWATGNTFESRLPGPPVLTAALQKANGTHTLFAAGFKTPPAGATHLIAVLDSTDVVYETDEGNNVAALEYHPDIVVKSVKWTPAEGGADVFYDLMGRSLTASEPAELAVYWAQDDTPVGGAIFTTKLDGKMGTGKKLHVPADKLTNLPFSTDAARITSGQNLLDANRLRVVADPDDEIDEENPQGTAEDNNVASKELHAVTARPGFNLTFTHPVTGQTTTLDPTLLDRFMKLASGLVAQNVVTADITLNEGVRDPAVAHRWSTSWMIRYHSSNTLLQNLQALPNGADLDGNVWYDQSWEDLVRAELTALNLPYENASGDLTAAAKHHLWTHIRANSLQYDTRPNNTLVAADGYAQGDPYRLPNTHGGGVSHHILGLAIDASIAWRAHARISTGVISNGTTADPAANALVATYDLRRPVASEKHHFELV
jgi:hypothetical protein